MNKHKKGDSLTDVLIIVLGTAGLFFFLLLLWAGPVHAEEFGVFSNKPVAERHRPAALVSFGITTTLFAAGVKPEFAAPAGVAITALTEHVQHNGRHGMTVSEYRMILAGGVLGYGLSKWVQVYLPVKVETDGETLFFMMERRF